MTTSKYRYPADVELARYRTKHGKWLRITTQSGRRGVGGPSRLWRDTIAALRLQGLTPRDATPAERNALKRQRKAWQ